MLTERLKLLVVSWRKSANEEAAKRTIDAVGVAAGIRGCIVDLERAVVASAAPAEGRDASLVRAITDWPGYWIDGQKVTAEDYIAWLLKRLDETEAARLPEPKYYGSQDEDGDQHEVKCAYVDGWNACRAAMPATAPTMSEAAPSVVLTYSTRGHSKPCGQTMGANGCGEFCILYYGEIDECDRVARKSIEDMQQQSYRFDWVSILRADDEAYHGPVIKVERIDRAATKGESDE